MSFSSTYEAFGACELACLDNIQVVTIITLLDDLLTGLEREFLHGTEYNLKLIRVQVAEHEGLAEAGPQSSGQIVALRVEGSLELLFLVPVTESFGADRGAWASLSGVLFYFFHGQVKNVVFAIATIGRNFGVGGLRSFICRRVLVRDLADLTTEFGDLVTQEIQLHALVHIESGPSAVVIAQVLLHVSDLKQEIQGSRKGYCNGCSVLTGSEGSATNILMSIGFKMSSTLV